ncbi:helix-turn-helix domain-containing protein [Streptomyces sp. SID5785]|uniref:helix-turn-helix domain-containing protein n=1 Tax=Streptomyces sp. SID5785 TaxID=2690309 RepID=UPI001361B586|nr:helix-turn-helix transcriptional regulator [Streptomyces sp. SID5785]MZD05779.1 helix-turn-helix domain-containing protein [Streptomyces sp. SID5785]
MAGSPTARRRRLSIELKKLRETSGMTCAQVGAAMDWSGSKVNRMETGHGRVQPTDVEALCRLYETSDELRGFLRSLAQEAKTKGWWQLHGSGIPEWFNIYIGLEQDAASFRQYQCEVVPGLLQSPDYIRALHVADSRTDPFEVERAIDVRMERQGMLTREHAPEAAFICHEAALRNLVGGRSVMRGQLERLLGVGDSTSVTLQVLPFDSAPHPITGAFTILGFPDPEDPDVVYRDGITDAVYLEGEPHVREYTRAFELIQAAALDTKRSRQLISRTLKENIR